MWLFDQYQNSDSKQLQRSSVSAKFSGGARNIGELHDHLLLDAGIRVIQETQTAKPTQQCLQGLFSKTIRIRPNRLEARGALVTYHVMCGRLLVEVKMLNIAAKAPKEHHYSLYCNEAFSNEVLLKKSQKGGLYVTKRHYFSGQTKLLRKNSDCMDWKIVQSYSEMEGVLTEYAIAKICQALKIGVKVGSPDHMFDLVCYEDAVEFYMEKCKPITKHIEGSDFSQCVKRLRECVNLMHSYGLVHKDIKPDNILVNGNSEVVLADFGVSVFVKQKPGEKSLTFREGTYLYMSPEMRKIDNGRGRVDLYSNDIWAFSTTVQSLRARLQARSPIKRERAEDVEGTCRLDLNIASISQLLQKGYLNLSDSAPLPQQFVVCFQGASQSVETDIEVNFIIRSIGVSYRTIPYLQRIANPSKRTEQLLLKIRSGISDDVELCTQYGEQLGDEEMLRRACFRSLRKLQMIEKPKQQVCELVCELAWEFIRSLHLQGLWEEPLKILNSIQRIAVDAHLKKYRTLKVANDLVRGDFSPTEIYEFLKEGLEKEAYHDLLPGVVSCFRKNEVVLGVLIVGGSIPGVSYDGLGYAQDQAYRFLVKVFKHATLNEQTKVVRMVLKVLEVEFRLGHHQQFASLSTEEVQILPLQLQKVYFSTLAYASYIKSDLQASLENYAKARQLSLKSEWEWTIDSLTINLERCVILQNFGISDQAVQTAKITLDYITQVGSAKERMLVGYANIILAVDAYQKGDLLICLKRSQVVLSVVTAVYHSGFSSLLLLSSYVVLLTNIFPVREYPQTFLGIVKGMWQFAERFYSSPINRNAIKYYPVQLLLGLMLEKLSHQKHTPNCIGDSPAFENALQLFSKHKHCLNFLMKHDPIKAREEAISMNESLEVHSCSIGINDMLYFMDSFAAMHRLGMVEQSLKWTKMTIASIQKHPSTVDVKRVELALSEIWGMGLEEQTYSIAAPLTNLSRTCIFYTAIYLLKSQQHAASEQLFLRYIAGSNSRNSTLMPDMSPQEYLASSHWHLTKIYLSQGDNDQADYHKKKAFSYYNHLESLPIENQDKTILQFYQQNGYDRNYHSLKIKLHKFTCRQLPQDANRIRMLSSIGVIAYNCGQYHFAIKCLKEQYHTRTMNFEELFALSQCFIITGQRRAFYRTVKRIKEHHSPKMPTLKQFLTRRKEFIKIHVLFGDCPAGYTSLKNVSEYMKNGLPTDYSKKSTLRQKLLDLNLLKRLSSQQANTKELKGSMAMQCRVSILNMVNSKVL